MEKCWYKKGAEPALDADFQAAAAFGKIRLGRQYIYGRRLLRWQLLPLDHVVQVWQRIEQVQSHTSCCEADFNIHRLRLKLDDGTVSELFIGDELFRHEDMALLEAISAQRPEITICAPETETAGKKQKV